MEVPYKMNENAEILILPEKLEMQRQTTFNKQRPDQRYEQAVRIK